MRLSDYKGKRIDVDSGFKYYPAIRYDLQQLVIKLVRDRGMLADLNDIYTGNIIDMSNLFNNYDLMMFNGDISEWDMSNVNYTCDMFKNTMFRGDHSDLSHWDMHNVVDAGGMFMNSMMANDDVEKWKMNRKCNVTDMFTGSPMGPHLPRWYKTMVK